MPNNQNNYAKYSGLAFQMFGILGFAIWGGLSLDRYLKSKIPAFTIIFALLAFVAFMYKLIRSVQEDEKD
jgi:F0F1-type ATP synthase assembly protein I